VSRSTVALVESATQLLNVAEWAHTAGVADDVQVLTLAPCNPHTVRQLHRVAGLVAATGLAVRTYPVRTRTPAAITGAAHVLAAIARAECLVIGDPFSRYVQTLLPAATAPRVVVVDDGTATWEFARCIDAGRPLVRWGVPTEGPQRRAARATRLLSPAPGRDLTVFSCLLGATPLSATALANRYAWTRAWRRPDVVDDEVDLLGVSLVDNGVIERAPYVAAVTEIARGSAPVRYLAHRRESAGLLAEIAAVPGVRVVRPDLPVELALRRGPVARRIVSFPSTATHTLPVVLGDLGVRVEVRPVEPSWFTATTTGHARRFVARIAESAPSPPLLQLL
jgi:hypothetical protein